MSDMVEDGDVPDVAVSEVAADPGLSATIAADSVETVQRPEGLPTLIPPAMLGKNRRKRAEFWKHAGSEAVSAVSDNPLYDSGDLTLAMAGVYTQSLADIEDALRCVVIPQAVAAFQSWIHSVDDGVLIQAFNWYMQEMQPGEAKPSPS